MSYIELRLVLYWWYDASYGSFGVSQACWFLFYDDRLESSGLL